MPLSGESFWWSKWPQTVLFFFWGQYFSSNFSIGSFAKQIIQPEMTLLGICHGGQFTLELFPEAMMKLDKCLFVKPTNVSQHPQLKSSSSCSLLTLTELVHFFLQPVLQDHASNPKVWSHDLQFCVHSDRQKPLLMIYTEHCNKALHLYGLWYCFEVWLADFVSSPEAGWRSMDRCMFPLTISTLMTDEGNQRTWRKL